jgi:isopentenyldiphosphate isomerase
MQEMLEVYSRDGKRLGKVIEKDDFHDRMREEYLKGGKVTIKHLHGRALLLTTEGKLILQKRSKWKGDNPGLWDKSIGGHSFNHEAFDFTIVRECAEELQIPSTVVKKADLAQSLKLIDSKMMAILFQLEVAGNDVSLRREKNGKLWEEPAITAYYLGYYDGPIRFKPVETSGFRVSTLEEILREMKSNPKSFTKDMSFILKKWKSLIKPVRELK